MPGDINTRMRIVDSCLRKKDGCTYREILTECKKQTGIDVPETTLRDTIRKLKKKLNVDIVLINNEEDNRSKRFRYKVIPERTFESGDGDGIVHMEQYVELADSLCRLCASNTLEGLIDDMVNKMKVLQLLPGDYVKPQPILQFDENPLTSGTEHFDILCRCIMRQKPINIVYQPYRDTPDVRGFEDLELLIHPYWLKEYNYRWYLFGYVSKEGRKLPGELRRGLSAYPLDRIKEVSEDKSVSFRFPQKEEVAHYFDNVIGATVYADRPVEHIVLRAKDRTEYNYYKSNPFHKSQKTVLNDPVYGKRVITIDVVPNYELYSLLLSCRDNIEVVAPESVRNKLIELLESSLNLYRS